jgi:hypothetical protein
MTIGGIDIGHAGKMSEGQSGAKLFGLMNELQRWSILDLQIVS